MKSSLRCALLTAAVLAVPSTVLAQWCGDVCSPWPPSPPCEETQCYVCQTDYPDGYCPPGEISGTNCYAYRGNYCPQWSYSEEHVGRGIEDRYYWSYPFGAWLPTVLDIHVGTWTDLGGVYGSYQVCIEEEIEVCQHSPATDSICCQNYGCWGLQHCS